VFRQTDHVLRATEQLLSLSWARHGPSGKYPSGESARFAWLHDIAFRLIPVAWPAFDLGAPSWVCDPLGSEPYGYLLPAPPSRPLLFRCGRVRGSASVHFSCHLLTSRVSCFSGTIDFQALTNGPKGIQVRASFLDSPACCADPYQCGSACVFDLLLVFFVLGGLGPTSLVLVSATTC
jgi:hypothetical protein